MNPDSLSRTLSESLPANIQINNETKMVIKPSPQALVPLMNVPPLAEPTQVRNGELFIMMGIYVNRKDIDTSNKQYHNPLNKTGQDTLRKAQDKRARKLRTRMEQAMFRHSLGSNDLCAGEC